MTRQAPDKSKMTEDELFIYSVVMLCDTRYTEETVKYKADEMSSEALNNIIFYCQTELMERELAKKPSSQGYGNKVANSLR